MSPDEEVVQKDRGTSAGGKPDRSCHPAHRDGVGTIPDGMGSNLPVDDWIRFQHLQIFSISARRNRNRQHPASAGAAQPGLNLDRPGHARLSRGGLAASQISQRDWRHPVTTHLFHLIRSLHACHPDRNHHVLRRFAAPWTLLAETFCRTSDLRRCFHDSTQLSEH